MSWEHAQSSDRDRLLRQITAVERYAQFHPDKADVEVLPVPFYEDGKLIRCRNRDWKDGEYFWYVKLPEDEEVVSLDGSVANVHHLNFKSHMRLTKPHIPAYLKYWLFFVRDKRQPRHLLDNKSWNTEAAGDDFTCNARFTEGRAMFEAKFKITPRGEVTILEKAEHPLPTGYKWPDGFSFY